MKPNDHLMGHGCPECAKSFGKAEKLVLDKLNENFENVEYQKKFDFLQSKTSYQTLDFYLPDFNVGIEYQGRQHFLPQKRFGGEKQFEIITERDNRKYNRCLENGVKIYYISFEKKIPDEYIDKIYTDIDELISVIKSNETVS